MLNELWLGDATALERVQNDGCTTTGVDLVRLHWPLTSGTSAVMFIVNNKLHIYMRTHTLQWVPHADPQTWQARLPLCMFGIYNWNVQEAPCSDTSAGTQAPLAPEPSSSV